MLAAAMEEFGEEVETPALAETDREVAVVAVGPQAPPPPATAPGSRPPWSTTITFLVMIAVGGLVAALLRGDLALRTDLGADYSRLVASGWPALLVLLAGGLLVGFGARRLQRRAWAQRLFAAATGQFAGHCGVLRGCRRGLVPHRCGGAQMDRSLIRDHFKVAPFGLLLGFTLSELGFAEFGQVHRMFTFVDLRLLFAFAAAVILTMAGFRLLAHKYPLPAKPIHKGTVAGGLLFGVGWAVTGACPAVPLVQLGEGRLPAAATTVGVVLGILIYRWLHAHYLQWDTGSCSGN